MANTQENGLGVWRFVNALQSRIWMLILKRLTIWAAEMISQVLLLALLLIGLFGHDQHAFGKDLLFYAVAILLMFFSTGYLATTAITRAVWKWGDLWLYSAFAAALFAIHFEVMNIGLGRGYAPKDQLPIWMAGAGIAFLSTYTGTAVLQRWAPSPAK